MGLKSWISCDILQHISFSYQGLLPIRPSYLWWPWDLSLRDFPGLCIRCICSTDCKWVSWKATMRNTNCPNSQRGAPLMKERGWSGKSFGISKKGADPSIQSKSQRLPPCRGSGFSSDKLSFFLRQIYFTIWDKYILQFDTNTFCNLRQVNFAIWYKYILKFETNIFFILRQIYFAIQDMFCKVDQMTSWSFDFVMWPQK